MDNRGRALRTFRIYEMARQKAGVTDYAVAQDAKVSSSCICDWRHGRYTPKADKLYRISKSLGIPFDAFMEGE